MTDAPNPPATPTAAVTTSLFAFGINVVDIDREAAFYCDVLGMVQGGRFEIPRDEGTIIEVLLRAPDQPEGAALLLATGIVHGEDEPSVESFGRLVIQTSDVAAVCERVRSRGGIVEREPYETPGGRIIAMMRDPEGVKWELIQSDGPIVS